MEPDTREIEKTDWRRFCDEFSRRYRGWRVTIESLAPPLGREVSELPLAGIVGDTGAITVMVCPAGEGASVTHTVENPRHLRVHVTPQGAEDALEIEGNNGDRMLLRFRSPVPAVSVDGLARARGA